jgi:hypothetical protein
LFQGPVEITEKIDGSQFAFGKINGELVVRSKGRIIEDYHALNENDLFYPVVQWVMSLSDTYIGEGMVYYGETLKSPKHNTLRYEHVPKNHFMLFGACEAGTHKFVNRHAELVRIANWLDCGVVPLLYEGEVHNVEAIEELMNRTSILGGTNAEGVVVKNYNQPFLLGGQPIPLMMGKYVTEAFKEVHRKNWTKENTGAGKWELFKQGYRTEARWQKAVQRLEELDELEHAPRDIGKLIVAIKEDIKEEEKEDIKNFLWQQFGQDVLRVSTSGFPEWYKKQLLERGFSDDKVD